MDGESRRVQQETKRKAEGIERGVRPPMGADPELKNEPASILPWMITWVRCRAPWEGRMPFFHPVGESTVPGGYTIGSGFLVSWAHKSVTAALFGHRRISIGARAVLLIAQWTAFLRPRNARFVSIRGKFWVRWVGRLYRAMGAV